ncbi:TPA: NUDIX domain-containing protein [Serratia fonticola]|nr:NUDIX domain-containing protein [Serratia fonticola]
MMMNADKVIRIAAAIMIDAEGRMLLVRKRDTRYFMQPGGKIESTERPVAALIRELKEELQISVTEQDTQYVGQFTDTAANEPGHTLIAEIFTVLAPTSMITPAAEIEEITWFHPSEDASLPLAPLTGQ